MTQDNPNPLSKIAPDDLLEVSCTVLLRRVIIKANYSCFPSSYGFA